LARKRQNEVGLENDGEWFADKLHGKGKMKFQDGQEYDGEWQKGIRGFNV